MKILEKKIEILIFGFFRFFKRCWSEKFDINSEIFINIQKNFETAKIYFRKKIYFEVKKV